MREQDFGPRRFGRSTEEADFHQARLEAIEAFLIESKVLPEEMAVLPSVSRHRLPPRRLLIIGGPFAAAALSLAPICGGGENGGGGGEEGNGPPPVSQDEGLRLPIRDGELWYLTAGPHYDGLSDGVRYALDFAPKEVTKCPGGAPAENYWAVAVDDGKVVIVGDANDPENHSVVEVEHEDGLRSGYMHLDNIQVEDGQEVEKGQRLGNPSCEYPPGGASSGVHLHAYAKDKDGKALPVNGIKLSGWEAVEGEKNYDGRLLKEGEEPRTADKRRCGPDEESIKVCDGIRNDLMVGEVLGEITTATPEPEGILVEATATARSIATPEPTATAEPKIPEEGRAEIISKKWVEAERDVQRFIELLKSGTSQDLQEAFGILIPEWRIEQVRGYGGLTIDQLSACSREMIEGEFQTITLIRGDGPKVNLSETERLNIERGLAERSEER